MKDIKVKLHEEEHVDFVPDKFRFMKFGTFENGIYHQGHRYYKNKCTVITTYILVFLIICITVYKLSQVGKQLGMNSYYENTIHAGQIMDLEMPPREFLFKE